MFNISLPKLPDPIKAFTQAVSATSNQVNETGSFLANSTNQLLEQSGGLSFLMNPYSNINTTQMIGQTGKNIERSGQNALQGMALMATGNFNNADRTLLDMGTMFIGVNPDDDVTRLTGKTPAMQRSQGDAATNARLAAEEDVKNAAEAERTKRIGEVNSTIAGIIGAQRRSPGRSLTLIGGGTNNSNTLLTYANSNR